MDRDDEQMKKIRGWWAADMVERLPNMSKQERHDFAQSLSPPEMEALSKVMAKKEADMVAARPPTQSEVNQVLKDYHDDMNRLSTPPRGPQFP